MKSNGRFTPTLFLLIATLWPVSSHAITVHLDQFTIIRDGTTVFDDTFTDNIPPPSGPAGAGTYSISQGTIPAEAESGGLLELDSANGSLSSNAANDGPHHIVSVVRLTSITGGASQLGIGNLLSVSGLFNLTIPTGPLFSGYGIRFTDNTAARAGAGQLLQLQVVFRPTTGEPEIAYLFQDFGEDTLTRLASTVLSPPAGADQILLTLFQAETGGEFFGSYEYFNGGVGLGGGTFTEGGALFQEVNYVRGQFFVTEAVAQSVPDVIALTQSAASSAIAAAGLVVGTVTTQSSSTVAAGNVISQNPIGGTTVAAGSAVDLVVSSGPAQALVPNVVGQTQTAATSAISAAGLIVGTVTQQSSATVPTGNVISQNPTAGNSVAFGSTVNLVVSTGPVPGDVNGDSAVTCADVTIVKLSFGRRLGQPGYDARADVNKDGIVDIRDLSFVTQRLPTGTTCK